MGHINYKAPLRIITKKNLLPSRKRLIESEHVNNPPSPKNAKPIVYIFTDVSLCTNQNKGKKNMVIAEPPT